MSGYTIREPNERELKEFYNAPALPRFERVWGLFLCDGMVAVSGVIPDPQLIGSPLEEVARTIGFLDVRPGVPLFAAMDIVRRMRAWLRDTERTVWVQHDDKFPRSERLLTALGFRPTNEVRRDLQNTDRQLRMWCRPAVVR